MNIRLTYSGAVALAFSGPPGLAGPLNTLWNKLLADDYGVARTRSGDG